MTSSKVSSQGIYRRINLLSIGGNILGAFVTYFYLTALDPLPSGAASMHSPEAAGNFFFAIAVAVLFVGIYLLGRNLDGPIRQWHTRIESGVPASEMPQWVARRVLNLPLIGGAIDGAGWLFSAVFFATFYDNPNNLIGILIGGILTTAVVFSGRDLLWRQVLPLFFPQGKLSEVPAVRLWVRRRLMVAFTLIAITTPILLVIVTQQRTNLLETAANAQVILDNLLIVQLFILTTGLVIGFLVAGLVARAIVEPIDTLQKAMGRVEHNELDAQVQVTTNDELGYLGERFNQMTAGLREGEKLHRLFGLYVSPQVARAAVQTGAGLGGELVDCSVMFSDMRDFTTLTEQLPPGKLVELINEYMTTMVGIIVEHGGVVTRFGGDSILAVFGSPLNSMSDHADRAVATAVAMRRELAAFNEMGSVAGRPRVESGIGIASGPVIAGNVGGRERIEYTVMGDSANLAARLEAMTKDLNAPILISAETHAALTEHPNIDLRPVAGVRVKGKQDKVTIYALAI